MNRVLISPPARSRYGRRRRRALLHEPALERSDRRDRCPAVDPIAWRAWPLRWLLRELARCRPTEGPIDHRAWPHLEHRGNPRPDCRKNVPSLNRLHYRMRLVSDWRWYPHPLRRATFPGAADSWWCKFHLVRVAPTASLTYSWFSPSWLEGLDHQRVVVVLDSSRPASRPERRTPFTLHRPICLEYVTPTCSVWQTEVCIIFGLFLWDASNHGGFPETTLNWVC